MCIIFLANKVHSKYPLIIASNRDEFFDRPTEPMKIWSGTHDHGSACGDATSSSSRISNERGGTCLIQQSQAHHSRQCQQEQHPQFNKQRRRSRRLSLAGRDLVSGGTWLGLAVSPSCDSKDTTVKSKEYDRGNDNSDATQTNIISPALRWIVITNHRAKKCTDKHGKPSRGGLLSDFLEMSQNDNNDIPFSAESFVSKLVQCKGGEYNGFNLLVGDEGGIYYYGNHEKKHDERKGIENLGKAMGEQRPQTLPLPPGIYGLSNALLDTQWPKVERGKEMLRSLCKEKDDSAHNTNNKKGVEHHYFGDSSEERHDNATDELKLFHERLMHILHDQTQPTDDQLPDTGLDLPAERYLSSIFVPEGMLSGKEYGTRSSTTIVVQSDGKVSVLERTWPKANDQWFYFDDKGNVSAGE